jgi:hypothetical protein
MLHACLYTICFVFCYTSWHFYAFSRTNLLTRCHSASSLFSAIFVFQKSYTGNILGIGRNKSQSSEGFRSIENKKFPTSTNKNRPRSDLRDAKQRAGEIRSTYPCRSHSGNVQMNVVGVVVLASPPRDPIRSKRHNGRHLRALHTYSTTTSPSPRSSEVQWSGRWAQ